jgi:ribosomal protein L22
LLRLLRQREAADREARIKARRLRRADAKMAKEVALEAIEYLEELERARWNATKQEREYAEMIAEMERKTKRYFHVTDERKGTTARTGGLGCRAAGWF